MVNNEKTSKDVQKQEEQVKETIAIEATPPIAPQVCGHISVVIPYCKDLAQGKELLYALRSWQKQVRFGINIVVIGDREDWFSDDVTFIEHQRTSDNPQIDTTEKLKLAIISPEVTDRFIWTGDDIYLVNPTSLAHIELPKVLGELNPEKQSGTYAANMRLTVSLLKKECLPILNYNTHTPVLFDKERLTAMFERFSEALLNGCLFTSVYFNSFLDTAHPVYMNWKTDQVLLPISSQKPDENTVLEFLANKVFLTNSETGYSPWLEQFLQRLFPEPSDFEV